MTDQTWRGEWLLIYFGYTHCPDMCPMALSNIAEALDQLDTGMHARLRPIFVTVDPERDTPSVMKDYVGAFPGAGIVGLTGTPEQVAAIEAAYRINARRHDAGDGERVQHRPYLGNLHHGSGRALRRSGFGPHAARPAREAPDADREVASASEYGRYGAAPAASPLSPCKRISRIMIT